MKYKLDAKKEATEMITKFKENNLDEITSIKCAITTTNIILSNIRYGTCQHSLFMRILNYLNYLVDEFNKS